MDYEKSVYTKFKKEIYRPFIKAVSDYHLIDENDKILVCISGGKDSCLLALLLRHLQRYSDVKFDLEYALMDPGYSKDNLNTIMDNLHKLDIDVKVYETRIFEIDKKIHPKNPCYLCSKMRRGHLYNIGKELGCNKIALGHNFDDVIETLLLNMIFNGNYSGMVPILDSANFSGMKLIRPMYLVRENDVVRWANYNKLNFGKCDCPLAKEDNSKRREMKELIEMLDEKYDYASANIFNAMKNINLNTLLYSVEHKFHDDE